MRKKNSNKQYLTILFVIFTISNVFAQADLSLHYEDKSFDKQKSAFVKNELIIDNDSVYLFETRYKVDFSDSICNRLLYMPINMDCKTTLLELINRDIKANNLFDSSFHELKFDKNQRLFTSRLRLRVNGTDYFLYDNPNVNEAGTLGIKNDRAKFEQCMRIIETCMIPDQQEKPEKNEVLSISENPSDFFNVLIEQTIQSDRQTNTSVVLNINNQGVRTVKYVSGLKNTEVHDTIADFEKFKSDLKNLVRNENLSLMTVNPVYRIPDIGQTSGYIQISMVEEPWKYDNQKVTYCFSWLINSAIIGNQ